MKRLYGVLLVIVSSIAFGTMAVLAPVAYDAGTNPITLLFLRFTIAGLAMTVTMIVRRVKFPKGRLLLGLVLMGGVWYVVQSLAYFTALTMVSASLVVLLLYLYPALVTLISAIALKERITTTKLLALGLALVGTILTIGPSGEGESLGILLALSAALLYATYIVVGDRLMKQVKALPATTVIMLAAGVSYGGMVAVQGFQPPTATAGWAAILATAVCSIIALGTFFSGLERVGSSNAAILSTMEPFVAVGLAALLLGERIEPVQLVGGFCILVAVVFLARAEFDKF
ncbi:MAG: DMT family transporter [Chloroflexi bacterium]|nr:DMT family transporter [Chloroflexota bacterium]